MRWKRYGFLSAIVEGYTSLDDFVRDKSELFAVLGKELEIHDNYVIVSFNTVSDGCESYRMNSLIIEININTILNTHYGLCKYDYRGEICHDA